MRLEQVKRQRPMETRLTGTDHRATENCIAAELMNLCADGGKLRLVSRGGHGDAVGHIEDSRCNAH